MSESACHYCGLPVPRAMFAVASPTEGEERPEYCCFGCRFAAEVTRSRGEEGAVNWTLTRLGLAIFLTMNVMVFTMALWSQDLYGPDATATDTLSGSLRGVFRYLSLLFALPVLLILGDPLVENAWQALRRGQLATDLLLMVGVLASYLYSVVSVLRDDGPVYFEVGCMVLVLVTLGRWLEAAGKLKTTAAIESLHKLLPDKARGVRPTGEGFIALNEVVVGDHLRVLPGERIPCDGRIVCNRAAVDEQILTGESHPTIKECGDRVFGGTLCLDGDLTVEVEATAGSGALALMIELVRQARLAKGRHERLADRISACFLPIITVLALASFGVHTWLGGLDRGILVGLAVLLIACPCALGLATPMAVWAALGRAARAQVLFRNGEALERLASIRAVRLDKTGTLTTGMPRVAEYAVHEEGQRGSVLALALNLASASNHAHCAAIRAFKPTNGSALILLPARSVAGRGIIAQANGTTAYLGNPRWLDEEGVSCPASLGDVIARARNQGQALTCLATEGVLRGVFILSEELRPETIRAIAELRALNLDVAILTGDHATRGRILGAQLGVRVEAEQLPEDKMAAIERTRRNVGPVAMVGDGINDAPALAGSDVGIALGCGTDVSRDSASVCLLGDDLTRLPWAIALARRTVRVIRGNLFWAFAYNVIGVGFACTGKLNPVLASLAMVLSSLFVVSNSLRLAARED
jgi:heavy metal translocating P-type ATPase